MSVEGRAECHSRLHCKDQVFQDLSSSVSMGIKRKVWEKSSKCSQVSGSPSLQ